MPIVLQDWLPGIAAKKENRLNAAAVYYVDTWKGVAAVGPPGHKMTPRVARTLAVGLLIPLLIFIELKVLIGTAIPRASVTGLLLLLCFGAIACVVAWLVIRPAGIRWIRWPWWTFALLGLGFVVKALIAAQSASWQHVTLNLLFYLVVVGIQEEFLFRGCIEDGLRDLGSRPAVILAGLLFGVAHAPVTHLSTQSWSTAILSTLGMGVALQLGLRWLRDRGGLLCAILVHGLMDFLGAR